MYKKVNYKKSTLQSGERLEGETIENKVDRMVNNKEPIKDGAPEIYTPREDGVQKAYNIKTCRFEVAADAMDYVARSKDAKRAERQKAKKEKEKEGKVIELNNDKGNNSEVV